MTKQALLKAKIDLFNIISNHALNDFIQANYKNGKKIGKMGKNIPYSLSHDTIEAKKVYDFIYSKQAEQITIEHEEQIKAFLLIYRVSRSEFLKEGTKGGNYYYSNELKELEVISI